MKRILFVSLFCCSLSTLLSQTLEPMKVDTAMPPPPPMNAGGKDEDDEIKIFTKVEQEAEFPGGGKAWIQFLTAKLGSFDAGKNGAPQGRYTVITRFIVSWNGKLSDASTETNYGYGMEKAVLIMIKESPDWKPAMQNGRPVNAYRRQPVTFVVE